MTVPVLHRYNFLYTGRFVECDRFSTLSLDDVVSFVDPVLDMERCRAVVSYMKRQRAPSK